MSAKLIQETSEEILSWPMTKKLVQKWGTGNQEEDNKTVLQAITLVQVARDEDNRDLNLWDVMTALLIQSRL